MKCHNKRRRVVKAVRSSQRRERMFIDFWGSSWHMGKQIIVKSPMQTVQEYGERDGSIQQAGYWLSCGYMTNAIYLRDRMVYDMYKTNEACGLARRGEKGKERGGRTTSAANGRVRFRSQNLWLLTHDLSDRMIFYRPKTQKSWLAPSDSTTQRRPGGVVKARWQSFNRIIHKSQIMHTYRQGGVLSSDQVSNWAVTCRAGGITETGKEKKGTKSQFPL